MSGSLYDLGVPYPIWDDRPSPAEASARSAARQGAQVHAVIARLAPLVPLVGDDDLMIEAAVSAFVVGRENGNLRRARVRVSLLVRQYLRVFLPRAAVFAGSEVPAGGGRADLLWAHPVGYFYDEVKTTTDPDPLSPATVEQVSRYAAAGRARFGPRFVGVRLVTLGRERDAAFMDPTGALTPLSVSPLAPTALAETALAVGRTPA